MKLSHFLAAALIAISISSSAAEKTAGLELGVGWQSSFGLIGFGWRDFIRANEDVHVTLGADFGGGLLGAGTRFYTDPGADKCWFVIDCKSRYFAGATVLRTHGGDITEVSDDVRGVYNIGNGWATNISVGSHELYGESFTMTAEIGYRVWMKRPSVEYQSGGFLQKQQDQVERLTQNSLSLAVTAGWLFW